VTGLSKNPSDAPRVLPDSFSLPKQIVVYDTTLRDGNQTPGVSFTLEEKLSLIQAFDEFGVHVIEAGWPYSSPRDEALFRQLIKIPHKAKISAFGSTRRVGLPAREDPNLNALIGTEADMITIFGKSSAMQAEEVLRTTPEDNLSLIAESVDYIKEHGYCVVYDAEHFYDGFREDSEYAMRTLEAAKGAGEFCLCDTNGGGVVHEICSATSRVRDAFKKPLGIHCHDDGGLAVANTIAALAAGATRVQGTFNGLGERCGNVDFCELLPTLELKYGVYTVGDERLTKLKKLSEYVERIAGFRVSANKPYVGRNAFVHTGGVHADAVNKVSSAYEHVQPELVGNERAFTLSEQAGRASIVAEARKFGFKLNKQDQVVTDVLNEVKNRLSFTDAELYIMLSEKLDRKPSPFNLLGYEISLSEVASPKATVEVEIGGGRNSETASGVGPVNAMDLALRKVLSKYYPEIEKVRLTSYRVGIFNEEKATAATTEVYIEFTDGSQKWSTMGESDDIVKASKEALINGYKYFLLRSRD